MSPFRGQEGGDENRTLIFWFLILILPLLGRLLKAVLQRFGLVEAEAVEAAESPAPKTRRRQREREAEGEDLWRRLKRGDEPRPPAAPVRRAPVAKPAEEEGAEAPQPLSVLGEVVEPGEAAEVSLESEAAPEPLAVLAEGGAPKSEEPLRRRGFRLARGELGRAIVLTEVLGPPLSLRGSR